MPNADGSIIIDTKLDTSGLQRGTDNVNKQLDGVVQKAHTAAQTINEKINTAIKGVDTSKASTGLAQSFDADSQKIRKILDDTSKSAKAKAAEIAGVYRKQGMSQSDAMKAAWKKIERSSEKGSEKVKGDMREITETAKKSGKKLGSSVGGGVQSFMSNASASFGKLGAAMAATFSVAKIIQFAKEASNAERQLSDALTGLQSIVEGQGRSFSTAQYFIDEYIKDGLIPAANAITAYKNLASRGYDDTQIRQVMTALKDASAYGRQAGYSMGDAVQGATEGLKNENSVLVDNAGVTKNVAKMWDEYAASIGTTANNLTQQQKIQAEVAGIMAETKFQTGDAAKVANTLSGQLQKLSFNFNNLKVAVGGIVNPIVQYVLPAINAAISAFTKLANVAAQVVSLLFGKVTTTGSGLAEQNSDIASTAIAGAEAENELADATKAAGQAAKKALAGFDELNILQDKAGGGGSSDGGAVSGGVAGGSSLQIEAETKIEDTISPKLQEIADKIKELIAPLKEIDFEPLKTSLDDLGGSFTNLGKTIGKALEWAWKDILVPLSKWTIEKAAPKTVQLLASAFDLVSKSLDPVIDGLDDFMDDIDPIVDFIEDNVIIVLEDWEERFRFVAETMEENAPEITGIIRNLGEAFSKCWEIIGPVLTKIQEATKKTTTFMNREFSIGVGLVIDTLYGLSEFVLGALTGDWERAWGGLSHIVSSTSEAMGKSVTAFEQATGISFSNIKKKAQDRFTEMKDAITGAWGKVVEYFAGHGIDLRVIGANITNSFKNALNRLIMELNAAIGTPLRTLNGGIVKLRGQKILGAYPFSGLPLIPVPKIPYLAQGAVIPPNAPFMAMLGDQRHGTNVEAPLSTIQEAVALVMEDFTGGMMAGFEATVAVLREILEAILGIEIGDEVIANAVRNYNRKMTVVKGG